MTSPGFRIRAGTFIGAQHKLKGINNQDSFHFDTFTIGERVYQVGLISDGCTNRMKKQQRERSRSEVGSFLLTQYAFGEIVSMLTLGMALEEIPRALYPRCVGYIGNIARCSVTGTPNQMAAFIERTFMASLLGFICDGEKLIIFTSGDGAFGVNEETHIIDQNDAPLYLAYHQIDRNLLGAETTAKLPTEFDVLTFDCKTVKRFWLSTDGIIEKGDTLDPELSSAAILTGDINALFAHEPKAAMGVQWWLNIQQLEGRFGDDVTVIAVSR